MVCARNVREVEEILRGYDRARERLRKQETRESVRIEAEMNRDPRHERFMREQA